MKKMIGKGLKVSLALAMIFSSLFYVTTPVSAAEVEYEIYPKPHEISYQDGEYVIRPEVNVVYDETIDDATKNRLDEILASKGKKVDVSNSVVEGKTNVYVATYNSGSSIEKYIQKKIRDIDPSVFQKFGGHYVYSSNDEIFVLGRDTDAAFYGITTLKHIFKQMEGSTIRNFKIVDYADTNIRGFIEGYYGIPWTDEDRMSLMKLGGDFKMTSYMFAPKDDPYHSSQWRELYPDEELAKIKKMVDVGIQTKCRFVWTIHPFMHNAIKEETYEADIAIIKAKFEQLYDIGVRQFGVLGDDSGSLPRSVIIRAMTDLQEWVDEKGDVYDLVFCPAGYNHSWQGNYSELKEIDKGFPKDVQIFWTGEAVCQPVEQITLDHFRRHDVAEGQEQRRSPLFWLNWPVNDINMGRLMMGKGSLLHTDINIDDLAGVVTNPMQDPEASKIAIFAVADYAWNIKGFDDDKSWADSFKYIEPDATEALHTLAKHMSNPQPNGHGLVLAESEELQPLLNEAKAILSSNGMLSDKADQLIKEMQTIINACNDIHTLTRNKNLSKELKPFTDSLRDLTTAIKLFTESKVAFEQNDKAKGYSLYSEASSVYVRSKEYLHKGLNNSYPVSPGSTHLIPLAELMSKKVGDLASAYVSVGEEPLEITASSNYSDFYQGKIENIVDGNPSSFAWHGWSATKGDYFQVNLSKPTNIYGIHVKNGTATNFADTFLRGKLEYTTNGKTWKDVNGVIYGPSAAEIDVKKQLNDVVAVRYICTEANGNWVSMREFSLDLEPTLEEETTFTMEALPLPKGWSGNPANMLDGNDETNVHFNVRQHESENVNAMIKGDYVGVKFDDPIALGEVQFIQGRDDTDGDYMKDAILQYSMDGENWIDIKAFKNTQKINIDLSDQNITAQYLRLYQNAEKQGTWLGMREIRVTENKSEPTLQVIRPTNGWGIYYGSDAALIDGNDQTNVHYSVRQGGKPADSMVKGDYIGVKLSRAVILGEIHILQGNNDSHGDIIQNATLQYSLDGKNWTNYETYVGKHEINLDLSDEGIRAQYVRLLQNVDQGNWLAMREFQVHQKVDFNGKVYTNVEEYKPYKANYFVDKNIMAPVKNVTLGVNEYIGLELNRIHELDELTSNLSINGLTIEVGKNEYEWQEVTAGKLTDTNARYIRIINKTDSAKTFNIDTFIVTTKEISGKSVYKTNFETVTAPLNVFDNDRTSQVIYGNSQSQGKYIIYDLGQVIHFDTFKAVCRDSEGDFPRHGKFSVSLNPDEPGSWTEILTLGNQDSANPNEETTTDEIGYVLPDHEISYNAKAVKDLNIDGRYLKYEIPFTKQGENRWTRFQEFEINNGEFVSTVNDPTFTSTAEETKGGLFEYMTDGNLSTMFIPSTNNGEMIYSLSDNNNINVIKVIQNKYAVSDVNVYARLYSKTRAAVDWINLGKLSQSVNEFILPTDSILLEVKLVWANGIPNITEIMTYSHDNVEVNKDKLEKLVNNKHMDYDLWITDSQNAYNEAIATGRTVINSEYASQNTVDDAVKLIDNAIANAKPKGNTDKLVQLISEAILADSSYLYTVKTWNVYTKALDDAREALKEENVNNLTQDMINSYCKDITDAHNGLVYNPSESEVASLLEDEYFIYINDLDKSLYTNNSYELLTSIYNQLVALLETNKITPVIPTDFSELNVALVLAKKNLVPVLTLPSLIEEFDDVDANLYTDETYNVYATLISNAEKLIVSGTNEQITKAIEDIKTAKDNLETIKFTAKDVQTLFATAQSKEACNYTQASYDELAKVIEEINKVGIENATDTELNQFGAALESKLLTLVSVADLKTTINSAKAIDKSIYSEASYQVLLTAVEDAEKLYENGTAEEIVKAIENIDTAIKGLILRVNVKEALDYINAIEVIDYDLYKEETISEYKKAYEVLLEMKENITNVLAFEFLEAKNAFEAVRDLPELKDADFTDVNKAIEEGKIYILDLYTDETAAILASALDTARQAVKDGADITEQAKVEGYAKAIYNAIAGLVTKDSVESLDALMKQAKAINKDKYTQLSYDQLLGIIEKVEKDIENLSKLNQQEIDALNATLTQAMNNLVALGDTTKLNQLLETAKATDKSLYTQESYDNLSKTITKIETALKDTSNMSEDDVATLYAELNKAMSDLVKTSHTDESKDPNNEIKPNPTPNPDGGEKDEQQKPNSDKTDTSDNSMLGLFGFACLISLGACVLLARKRKEN